MINEDIIWFPGKTHNLLMASPDGDCLLQFENKRHKKFTMHQIFTNMCLTVVFNETNKYDFTSPKYDIQKKLGINYCEVQDHKHYFIWWVFYEHQLMSVVLH